VPSNKSWIHVKSVAALGVLLVALIVLLPALSGCQRESRGKTLRVSLASDIRSTQFGVNRDENTDTVLHHVVEGLVAYREDLTVGPLLAESWEVSEDGRSYTFTLRPGLRFHNGQVVTASDVKWSWEYLLNPRSRWLCRNWYDGTGETGIRIQKIETLDERTVRFELAEPNYLFLARMAHMVCLCGIIHRDSLDAHGNWIMPIGTGPYRIVRWNRRKSIELERFADYQPLPGARDGYAGRREAFFDRIEFLVIPDASVAEFALLSGSIDIAPKMPAEVLPALARRKDVVPVLQPTLNWNVLLLQNEDPMLSDARMRRAIAHAINREQVAQNATQGLAHANGSAVFPGSRYDSEFQRRVPEYDPSKARQLIREAGYAGQPIRLQVNRQFQLDYSSAIIVAEMLRQIGLHVELEVLDWATQLKNYNTGNYQMMSIGFSARPDPTLMFDIFIGDRKKRSNVVFSDPAVVVKLRRSGLVTDPVERQRLFDEIHAAAAADSSLIGLFNHTILDAVRADIINYSSWPLARPRFWGVSRQMTEGGEQ